jgi:hypothetical protein
MKKPIPSVISFRHHHREQAPAIVVGRRGQAPSEPVPYLRGLTPFNENAPHLTPNAH